MEGLLDSVKSLAAYLLFVTVVKNMLGNSSYKKYAEFFMGLVLIILLIGPVTQLFSLDKAIDYYLEKNEFQWDYNEVENELRMAEEKRKEEIWADYERILEERAGTLVSQEGLFLEKAEFSLADHQEEGISIEGVSLWVSNEEENKIKVEKIKLNKDALDTVQAREIRQKLSDEFKVDKGQITVYAY